jgi:ParB-like chromosome segregation protein Spo0J
VRAHGWRRQIESGRAKSITDLAEQEGVTDAYVCRLLPLTCLAPDIVEAILDGRQPKEVRLAELLGNGPVGWNEQRRAWGFSN